MKIAVDAMGGDHAPEAIVAGALLAEPRCAADVILVGREDQLSRIVGKKGAQSRLHVIHAPDVIGMEEPGPIAIRKKRLALLSVAIQLMAAGDV